MASPFQGAPPRAALAHRMLPTTRAGRLACWLALGFVAWFALNQVLMGLRQDLDGLPLAPLILVGWAGLALGLAAGGVGLWAVLRRRERGALVFLATLPGASVLLFLLGEWLVPH